MTHDPMKSAAASAAAEAHVRTEAAKALDELTSSLVAAEARIATEASRADVAEQRVCELMEACVSYVRPCGCHHPACKFCTEDAALAELLSSTADIAERWVSKSEHGRMMDAENADHARTIEACSRAAEQRDAAIARAETLDENLATAIESLRAAERSRDEVGIQLAAAQAVIARMQPVVDAARASLVVTSDPGDNWDAKRDLNDALRTLDTVPGDALAPTSPAGAIAVSHLEALGIDTDNVKEKP